MAEYLVSRTVPHPGEIVAMTGTPDGVVSAAIQLSNLLGRRLLAVSSASKHEPLKVLGAAATIDRNTPNLEAETRTLSDDVDIVVDVIRGAGFLPLLRALSQAWRHQERVGHQADRNDFCRSTQGPSRHVQPEPRVAAWRRD
ncbi:hypothetical protein [Sedimentitalea sp.]|uniref:hypothetical protein n=1 Tax=Sedimentitalea sp. TaxID=2048915 RepID=UPI003296A53B